MAVLDRTTRPLSRVTGRRFGIPAAGILAAGFVAAAALLPVAQSSNATATGNQIRTLEMKRADLEARINLAQSEVAELAAVERVDRRARELGMAPAERVLYVNVSEAAPAAGMPARYLNDEGPATESASAAPWWKALARRLPRP